MLIRINSGQVDASTDEIRNSKIQLSVEDFTGHFFRHPIDAIFAFWKDPWLTEYVREVSFGPRDSMGTRDEDWIPECYFDIGTRQRTDDLQPLLADLLQCIDLAGVEQEWWKNEIAAGNHSASFAVMLVMLPYITRLNIGDGCTSSWMEYLDHVLLSLGKSFPPQKFHKHLDSFTFQTWSGGSELGGNRGFFDDILFLPTIRRVGVDRLENIDWGDSSFKELRESIGAFSSPVEEISISTTEAEAIPEDLDDLILIPCTIKRFDFTVNLIDTIHARENRLTMEHVRDDLREKAPDLAETRSLAWKFVAEESEVGGRYQIRCAIMLRDPGLSHELE